MSSVMRPSPGSAAVQAAQGAQQGKGQRRRGPRASCRPSCLRTLLPSKHSWGNWSSRLPGELT